MTYGKNYCSSVFNLLMGKRLITPYFSVGCYVDQASRISSHLTPNMLIDLSRIQGSPRSLPSYSTTSASLTNAACVSTCAGLGYAYAGTEYSECVLSVGWPPIKGVLVLTLTHSECYCGNSIGGALDTTDSDCNAACAGDASTKCGGSFRLSVYKTTSTPSTKYGTPDSRGTFYLNADILPCSRLLHGSG